MTAAQAALTKTRFLAGLQCVKRQWWEVHGEPEPGAPDLALENRLEWGRRVTERARALLGPGVRIDRERLSPRQAVAATHRALTGGAARLYEGAFEAEGVHVAVDALERLPGGWRLVEVKSSTTVKDEHVPDAAVQAWVLRRAGLRVKAVEVAHVNPACVHPHLDDLLVRADVSREAAAFSRTVARHLARQRAALAGPRPEVEVGPHCRQPRDCPFLGRCWGLLPEHHVRTLTYSREPLIQALLARGIATVGEIPDDVPLTPGQARQRLAVRAGRVVVEPGLAGALAAFPGPLAFLDFETVSPAIPAWDGCSPYTQVAVQFACETRAPGPGQSFHEHLAEPGGDPRPALAAALLEATRGARTVFAYYAAFEIGCIRHLARGVPALAAPLEQLAGRMADLLPVVRDHVYHPGFHGRFGLKDVLPTLLPHLAYDDLEVRDGGSAAALLERMLLLGPVEPRDRRLSLRADLLAYCRRDVVGLSALYDWLSERGRAPG